MLDIISVMLGYTEKSLDLMVLGFRENYSFSMFDKLWVMVFKLEAYPVSIGTTLSTTDL